MISFHKSKTLIFFILIFTIGLIIFLMQERLHQTRIESKSYLTSNLITNLKESKSKSKLNTRFLIENTVDPLNIKFETESQIFSPEIQSHLINEVENEIDPEIAKQRFTEIDTLENFKSALHEIEQSYDEAPDLKLRTQNKVLALYFLRGSSYLNTEMCLQQVKNQIQLYKVGSNNQKWAILWDALALAKMCSPLSFDELTNLANNCDEPEIKNQILSGLKSSPKKI